jgi:hypothetical protein
MDTATQINNLLLQLDRAALALTTPQHPDIELHLEIDCTLPGACGIVDCELIEAHVTKHGIDATLAPAHSHCVDCGTIYLITPDAHDVSCPSCATQARVPATNPV